MAKTPTLSTPTVIVRKKRLTTVTPAAHSVPPQPTSKSPTSSPTAQVQSRQSEAKVKAEPATSAPAAPMSEATPLLQTPQSSGLNKRQRQQTKRRERFLQSPEFLQISEALVTRWPHLFRVTPDTIKPLAIGIGNDLCSQLSDFDPKLVHLTLNQWMADHRVPYWKALMRGGPRYDLDGNPKGEVTSEQQENARQQRKAWFERREEIHKKRVSAALSQSVDTP